MWAKIKREIGVRHEITCSLRLRNMWGCFEAFSRSDLELPESKFVLYFIFCSWRKLYYILFAMPRGMIVTRAMKESAKKEKRKKEREKERKEERQSHWLTKKRFKGRHKCNHHLCASNNHINIKEVNLDKNREAKKRQKRKKMIIYDSCWL